MKNIENNETQATDIAVEKPSLRRPLIVLLSVFVALCLLTSALAVFTFVDFSEKGTGSTGEGESSFDYYAALLSDYVADLKESMVTGLTLPGFDSRIDEVTDENVKKYINGILLEAVALSDDDITNRNYLAKWSEAINYADDVFLYILGVEKEDGSPVEVSFFENAYMESGRVQIGMAYFGKDFDDKLIGLIPKDTYFETRASGSVDADDVILLSYTATETVKATEEGKEDTVKNHKNYTSLRIDLSEVEDTAWRDKLLASYGTVGQYFSFEHEEDIDKDGDRETVKYEGVIESVVVEERARPLTATLPDDFFGANPTDEEYAALNGATLTFRVIIDHAAPHEANTFDTMTSSDIATVNSFLSASGLPTFTPSNDISKVVNGKEQKGALTTLTTDVSTLKGEIKTLEGEIETLKGDIAKLEAEIASLEASDEDKTAEIETKNKTLDAKQESLAAKETSLTEKESKLQEKNTALDAALSVAREECFDFFKKELQDSYAESVTMTAGQLVYNYLLENLAFSSLPADEVAAMEEYAKQCVESDHAAMDAASKRNYRDIEQFAASYFGYDEKDYNGYEAYIKEYLAPYEIKASLLMPGIYNTFINDDRKLDAKIEAYIADAMELSAAEGERLTREEILANLKANYGDDYWELLRKEYAMSLVVYEYLAENNTIDWDMRDTEKK